MIREHSSQKSHFLISLCLQLAAALVHSGPERDVHLQKKKTCLCNSLAAPGPTNRQLLQSKQISKENNGDGEQSVPTPRFEKERQVRLMYDRAGRKRGTAVGLKGWLMLRQENFLEMAAGQVANCFFFCFFIKSVCGRQKIEDNSKSYQNIFVFR